MTEPLSLACCGQRVSVILETKADGTVQQRQRGYQIVSLKCAVCQVSYPVIDGFYKPSRAEEQAAQWPPKDR